MTLHGTRCLVLGGGGFIGTNLCCALLAAGAVVTGYGRRPRLRQPDHHWIEGDFEDSAGVKAAIAVSDIVFHLLGSADPGGSNVDPGNEVRRWLPASVHVLEACRDQQRSIRVLFLSSGGTVYRPHLPLPIAEDAPTDPISAYGIGKLTVEKYCDLFRRLYGLDCCVLRVANPYGPFQDPGRGQGIVAKLIHRTLTGQPIEIWGDGLIVRDFIFVDDVVDAIITASSKLGVPGPINIGSGVGRTLLSLVDDVESIVDREAHLRFLDARSADSPANILDIRAAAATLGWAPHTDWMDGLAATRDWIAATYGLHREP